MDELQTNRRNIRKYKRSIDIIIFKVNSSNRYLNSNFVLESKSMMCQQGTDRWEDKSSDSQQSSSSPRQATESMETHWSFRFFPPVFAATKNCRDGEFKMNNQNSSEFKSMFGSCPAPWGSDSIADIFAESLKCFSSRLTWHGEGWRVRNKYSASKIKEKNIITNQDGIPGTAYPDRTHVSLFISIFWCLDIVCILSRFWIGKKHLFSPPHFFRLIFLPKANRAIRLQSKLTIPRLPNSLWVARGFFPWWVNTNSCTIARQNWSNTRTRSK